MFPQFHIFLCGNHFQKGLAEKTILKTIDSQFLTIALIFNAVVKIVLMFECRS